MVTVDPRQHHTHFPFKGLRDFCVQCKYGKGHSSDVDDDYNHSMCTMSAEQKLSLDNDIKEDNNLLILRLMSEKYAIFKPHEVGSLNRTFVPLKKGESLLCSDTDDVHVIPLDTFHFCGNKHGVQWENSYDQPKIYIHGVEIKQTCSDCYEYFVQSWTKQCFIDTTPGQHFMNLDTTPGQHFMNLDFYSKRTCCNSENCDSSAVISALDKNMSYDVRYSSNKYIGYDVRYSSNKRRYMTDDVVRSYLCETEK